MTTTASIAALQTIETCKIIKGSKYEEMKNSFLNLAIPYFSQSEPGEVPKIKLHEKLTVTIWDRWDIVVKPKDTLNDIFKHLLDTYDIVADKVLDGAKMIYPIPG